MMMIPITNHTSQTFSLHTSAHSPTRTAAHQTVPSTVQDQLGDNRVSKVYARAWFGTRVGAGAVPLQHRESPPHTVQLSPQSKSSRTRLYQLFLFLHPCNLLDLPYRRCLEVMTGWEHRYRSVGVWATLSHDGPMALYYAKWTRLIRSSVDGRALGRLRSCRWDSMRFNGSLRLLVPRHTLYRALGGLRGRVVRLRGT